MKKSHIIAIIVVAIGIAILISASRDVTTYANFAQARQSGDRVKLVGQGESIQITDLKGSTFQHPFVLKRPE